MYWKNFRFDPKKMFLRVSEDSEISPKSSILHGLLGFCSIVLGVCKKLSNGQNLLKVSANIAGIIWNVFAIHLSYVSFNLQELGRLQCGCIGQNLSAKTSN